MAEEENQPSLHIDTDWKKQAQEEKRKLAEQESAKAAAAAPPDAKAAPAGQKSSTRDSRGQREVPPASFGSLVQSILMQVLFHLGDIPNRGGEPVVNMDMAKHQIDTLVVLEEKCRGNLSADEQRLIDTALYEARMRFVAVAQQYIG
ncbi:MAG: DUF1844 domain-containing protein [Phycisphaerales bacterium]|jgi:hypothetical protein|nr:DUF1844 domain-containing protein [Phycisphaerales bacterium]